MIRAIRRIRAISEQLLSSSISGDSPTDRNTEQSTSIRLISGDPR